MTQVRARAISILTVSVFCMHSQRAAGYLLCRNSIKNCDDSASPSILHKLHRRRRRKLSGGAGSGNKLEMFLERPEYFLSLKSRSSEDSCSKCVHGNSASGSSESSVIIDSEGGKGDATEFRITTFLITEWNQRSESSRSHLFHRSTGASRAREAFRFGKLLRHLHS